jgi:hypothetical protein
MAVSFCFEAQTRCSTCSRAGSRWSNMATSHPVVRCLQRELERGPWKGMPPASEENRLRQIRFVLDHGVVCTPQARPKGMPKRRAKQCLLNSFLVADEHGLTYVEGFALTGLSGIPALHAWCVDDSCRVVDVTWKRPQDACYFGVPYCLDVVSCAIANEFAGHMMSITEHARHLKPAELRR